MVNETVPTQIVQTLVYDRLGSVEERKLRITNEGEVGESVDNRGCYAGEIMPSCHARVSCVMMYCVVRGLVV